MDATAFVSKLMTAIGPLHEETLRAKHELEFLLDSKKWKYFPPRVYSTFPGGAPNRLRNNRWHWLGPEWIVLVICDFIVNSRNIASFTSFILKS